MALTAKDNGGKDFKLIPAGAHFAICSMIVDCGLQEGYSGKPQHKVYIRWECPDERVEFTKKGESTATDGPMTIGRFYTLSLSEKAALRHDLENWRGQSFTQEELAGFDLFKVLGKCCQLQIVHENNNGKVYANIKAVMGVSRDQRERAKRVKAENDLLGFSLETADGRVFEKLPEWLRTKIDQRIEEDGDRAARENNNLTSNAAPAFDDDIPF